MSTENNSNEQQNLRQNNIKRYFPENTTDIDINKVVLKILKERHEQEAKKALQKDSNERVETKPKPTFKSEQKNKNNSNKKKHDKPDKTCSFCKQTGHQRSKCPQKLYPGLNIDK
ncbi:hypothetical protein ACO0SA_004035 [Hanseniaspora valbyensis]